jgi:hypothetical protein
MTVMHLKNHTDFADRVSIYCNAVTV